MSNRDPSPYSLQIEIVHRKVKTSVSWLMTTEIVSIKAVSFKVSGSAGSWQDITNAPAYLLEKKYSYNNKTYIFETQLNGIDIWFELFGYGEY